MTAAAEAPLGLPAGSGAQFVAVDICYQPTAGGTVLNFAGNNYSEHRMTGTRQGYTAIGTRVPGAGTWRVGLCAFNWQGPAAVSDNDWVNGVVLVTN